VIDFAVDRSKFELAEVKSAFEDEWPAFVTRIVNELEQNGWIVRETEQDEPAYHWNPSRKFSPTKWLDEKLFGTQIKESPEQERPREKLIANGVENLANSELLAILIRSGRPGESAVMGGQKVSKAFDGRLEDLPSAGRAELKEISCSVEKTAYCQIMAGIELGRRVAALSDDKITTKICSSGEAIEFCQRHFSRLIYGGKQEEFHIVSLDTKNQVIDTHCITVGTLDASLVSREDIAVTKRLTESGKLLGIDVLDHIVLGRTHSVSIQETM